MHMVLNLDARFDNPLLHDAFDVSHYPILKTRQARARAKRLGRGRGLFINGGLPAKAERRWRSRSVSEPMPQLVSANYMRESQLTNFSSARTVDGIAHLSDDDDSSVDTIRCSQSTTVICDDPSSPPCEMDDDALQKTPRAIYADLGSISGRAGPSDDDCDSEGESLYSMDSADQEVHPLLLSMPMIPQIKLERKATVREPDPGPPSSDARNRTFLSPRIRDLRTPVRMSSRRYGRILPRTSPPAEASEATLVEIHDHSPPSSQTCQLIESVSWSDHPENRTADPENIHSVSEPTLNDGYTSDDEQEPLLKKGIDLSTHSDTTPEPPSHCSEPCIHEPVPPKRTKRSHQRSSLTHSISLSSLLHAVADGCTSLDILHRKPKRKPEPAAEPELEEPVPKAHNVTSKWAPKDGQNIIKVFVPSTDDIWMFRVPQDSNLADFTSRVATKLGFTVSFSGSLWDEPRYHFRTDAQFKSWVKGRIRFGRNLPIVAHVLAPLPLRKLSMDMDGCEVWCYV